MTVNETAFGAQPHTKCQCGHRCDSHTPIIYYPNDATVEHDGDRIDRIGKCSSYGCPCLGGNFDWQGEQTAHIQLPNPEQYTASANAGIIVDKPEAPQPPPYHHDLYDVRLEALHVALRLRAEGPYRPHVNPDDSLSTADDLIATADKVFVWLTAALHRP